MMRYRCPPTHDSGCNLPSIQDRRSGWFLDDLRVTGKSVTVCGTQESHRDSTQSGGFAPSPECGEPPVHIETDQRRGLAVLQQALHPRPHIGEPHVLYKRISIVAITAIVTTRPILLVIDDRHTATLATRPLCYPLLLQCCRQRLEAHSHIRTQSNATTQNHASRTVNTVDGPHYRHAL